jgi:transcriptional regulator with XRE-family HTH domain
MITDFILGAGTLGRDLDELARAVNGVIARRVKAERERLGMSLAALAEASGVALSTVDSLEHRRAGCSARELWKISLALDISISELCEPGRDKAPIRTSNRLVWSARRLARPGAMSGPNARRFH